MFVVQEKMCNECLFSKNKIVSDERKEEILEQVREEQTHFICHKASTAGIPGCCKGFYDNENTFPVALSKALNQVIFVNIK